VESSANSLAGKTLFVTGGNAGIGLATALRFARAGAAIAIFARRADRNAQAQLLVEQAGVRCLTFAGDVTDEAALTDALQKTAAQLGGLHYAFNNAGADQPAVLITELTQDDYTLQMDVNVKGTFLAIKHEIPLIKAAGGGAICNNASAAGLVGTPYQSLYAAAKFAVVGMTKSVALEYAKDGIRVNVVCPGATTGDMFLRYRSQFPQAAEMATAMHPMNRIGDKDEVGAAVLYLCRDATFTTGHAFAVDGGLTAG
jgi:NAD(P)-dependent dehydrogenase (short-subunit alcohol dehydrogenase family)